MEVAFRCRLQYNSDISKIRKFFEDTETIKIAAGRAGIALFAETPQNVCYYMVEIHECDIYQLYVDTSTETWRAGGVVRTLPGVGFNNFIKSKEVNNILQIEIDKDTTEMRMSILSGVTVVRSVVIPLTVPDKTFEYPSMPYANVIIPVNEFKKLCADMAKSSNEIRLEYQDEAIRLIAGENKVSYGIWNKEDSYKTCNIKNTAFNKATRINIGNAKNAPAGIYIRQKYPLLIKVKLGIVDFKIYSKVYLDIDSD